MDGLISCQAHNTSLLTLGILVMLGPERSSALPHLYNLPPPPPPDLCVLSSIVLHTKSGSEKSDKRTRSMCHRCVTSEMFENEKRRVLAENTNSIMATVKHCEWDSKVQLKNGVCDRLVSGWVRRCRARERRRVSIGLRYCGLTSDICPVPFLCRRDMGQHSRRLPVNIFNTI